jgi:NAD(P)-dependent dehydrogenase (short-subunit alcohol dehydrogenase family)
MDLELAGRRILVTGASKGIGLAVAARFGAAGADVVMVARGAAALEAAAADIRARYGVVATAIPADLSRTAEIERVAADAGEIDVLVNNAGAIPWGGLLDLDDAAFRAAWDLKVFGYIGMCRACYPALRRRGGVIVNVIGAAAEWLVPDYLCGTTGNAALVAFTKALGKGAAQEGVRVVAVNPGPVTTERMINRLRDQAARRLGNPERWPELNKDLPLGRPADPEEIADAVAFLASPRSGSTAAAVLTIDGGLGRARKVTP